MNIDEYIILKNPILKWCNPSISDQTKQNALQNTETNSKLFKNTRHITHVFLKMMF